MSPQVTAWWTFLRGASVLNLALWLAALAAYRRERGAVSAETAQFTRRHLALSLVFVLGCGFRSFLPRADVQRICLADSRLSCVLVGRSVATAAELCFVAQWALLLRQLAVAAGSRFARALSLALVPGIAAAEACSWTAVLTTCYLGNVCEESIWAASVLLLAVGALTLLPRASPRLKPLLVFCALAGAGYFAFMARVDVPMYLTRWRADAASGRAYLSLLDGIRDAATRWRVTGDIAEWRAEIPWMSLYFSVAVWLSVALTRAPRLVAAESARR
jgi:hypothetical protein